MFQTASSTTFKTKHIFKQLYPWTSKFELAAYLQNNIIHSSGGLIAINKPYGVGVQSPKASTTKSTETSKVFQVGCEFSLEDALPILRRELKLPKLVLIKSAEKFNSGIAVLGENEKIVERIRTLTRRAKALMILNSCYYMVTCFPPYKGLHGESHEERLAVTLGGNPYHNILQPVITRDFSNRSMRKQDVQVSRVQFTVKAITPDCKTSLIELNTNETRWNFLRVYCADMLMPILGDHLYGPRVTVVQGVPARLNPLHMRPGDSSQKLQPRVLEYLRLENEDTSLVPLHVHLKSYIIPNFYRKNEHLEITAPFTDMFTWTCRTLKLPLPS